MTISPFHVLKSARSAWLLSGAMAVLVALGSFLAGSAATCQGKTLQQQTAIAPMHVAQQTPARANAATGSNALATEGPSARDRAATSFFWCVLLPARAAPETLATLRGSGRDVADHALALQESGGPLAAAVLFSKLPGEASGNADAPNGFSLDSSPAQESLSTQRTVVLRL